MDDSIDILQGKVIRQPCDNIHITGKQGKLVSNLLGFVLQICKVGHK